MISCFFCFCFFVCLLVVCFYIRSDLIAPTHFQIRSFIWNGISKQWRIRQSRKVNISAASNRDEYMRNMSVLSLSFRNKYFKNRTNETRLFLHRIMLDAESRALNLTSKKKTPHLIHSASHSFCLARQRQREREETQREKERERSRMPFIQSHHTERGR